VSNYIYLSKMVAESQITVQQFNTASETSNLVLSSYTIVLRGNQKLDFIVVWRRRRWRRRTFASDTELCTFWSTSWLQIHCRQ